MRKDKKFYKNYIDISFKEGYEPRQKIMGGIGAYKSDNGYLLTKEITRHKDYAKLQKNKVTKLVSNRFNKKNKPLYLFR